MLPNIDKCLGFKTYLWSKTTTGLELTYPRCRETYYRNYLISMFPWDSWTIQTASRYSPSMFSLLFPCPHLPLHFFPAASAFSHICGPSFLHASWDSHVVTREPVPVPALPVTQLYFNQLVVWSDEFCVSSRSLQRGKNGRRTSLLP